MQSNMNAQSKINQAEYCVHLQISTSNGLIKVRKDYTNYGDNVMPQNRYEYPVDKQRYDNLSAKEKELVDRTVQVNKRNVTTI